MKLRNIAGLYLWRLRGRLGQELLALLGVAVGVSLLFAALAANTSLTGSFERATDRTIGDARLQLSARGSSTLDEGLLARVQRLPGVEQAGAVLERPGQVRGPRGRRAALLVGVTREVGASFDPDFPYRFLARVRTLALPAPLVDSLGVALGQPLRLDLGARTVRARLGATLRETDVGTVVDSAIAIAPLRYAQELAREPGRVSRIFVVPASGRDAMVAAELRRLAAGRANVRPADFDTALFREASLPTSQSTATFSVFGAMVGFLLAISVMLLTAPQRRLLILDLRHEGYRTGTLVQVLAFDALVLGVISSALGILLGDLIADRLFDETPSFLRYAFVVSPTQTVSAFNVATAAACGIAASCIAVMGSMASTLRHDDLASARAAQGAREGWPAASSCSALVFAVAVVIRGPSSTMIGIAALACLTGSMLLFLPFALRLLIAVMDALTSRMRSVVPFLASFDLRDPTVRARSLAVAATGAIAVFGSVALRGAQADLQRGLEQTSRDIASQDDLWTLPPGDGSVLMTTSFRVPRFERALGDEIERVALYRSSFLDLGDRRMRVLAPPSDGVGLMSDAQLVDGEVDDVHRRLRAGGWIVLSEAVARERGLHVGDRFTLPSPVPTRFRVAGLSTNLGWPPGSMVLNSEDYARAWGSRDASAILATLAPGTSPAEGRRALRAALGPRTALVVYTARERRRDQDAGGREGLRRLAQIAALVLLSAVIAMASAMALAGVIWQRRVILAQVRIEGYGVPTIWKALLIEAIILIGAGCATGVVFGLLGQALLTRALTSITGFPVTYSPAIVEATLIGLAVTTAAVTILALFGYGAARATDQRAASE